MKMITKQSEAKVSEIDNEAFEQSLLRHKPESFGVFTVEEKDILQKFHELNAAVSELGKTASALKEKISLAESAIQAARADYNRLISEGEVSQAMDALAGVPELRVVVEGLETQLAKIPNKLAEIEAAVRAIDARRFFREFEQARKELEFARRRAAVISSEPAAVQRAIEAVRQKL